MVDPDTLSSNTLRELSASTPQLTAGPIHRARSGPGDQSIPTLGTGSEGVPGVERDLVASDKETTA